MKHLFFIHSQITFLVSVRIIKYLVLNNEDCIFIIFRAKIEDFESIGIKKVEFPFNPGSIDSFPVFNKFWKSWKNLNQLNKFISDITSNNSYIFYTPQTNQKYLALIISYNKCKGYNVIEEGLGSYLSKDQLEKVYPKIRYSLFYGLLWRLNFLNRLKIDRPFIEKGYLNLYSLTPFSFDKLERKVVLGLPSINDFGINPQIEKENYKNVLVFDALVEANIIEPGILLLSTLILLNRLIHKGESILHVKFHSDQLKAGKTISLLRELFNQVEKIRIIEIPSAISLEEIAIKQDANFFVFVSSVGLYASLYGRRVYSLCKVIERLHPLFSMKIEHLPSIFKEKVVFI